MHVICVHDWRRIFAWKTLHSAHMQWLFVFLYCFDILLYCQAKNYYIFIVIIHIYRIIPRKYLFVLNIYLHKLRLYFQRKITLSDSDNICLVPNQPWNGKYNLILIDLTIIIRHIFANCFCILFFYHYGFKTFLHTFSHFLCRKIFWLFYHSFYHFFCTKKMRTLFQNFYLKK